MESYSRLNPDAEELDEAVMNELLSFHVEEEVPGCMHRSREALERQLQSASRGRARGNVSKVKNVISAAANAVSEAADAITAVEIAIETANNSVAIANNKIATAKDALAFYIAISGNAENAISDAVNAVSNIDKVCAENAIANTSNEIPIDDNAAVVPEKAILNTDNTDSNIDNVGTENAIANRSSNVPPIDNNSTDVTDNADSNIDNDNAKLDAAPSNADTSKEPDYLSFEEARRCGFKKSKPVFGKIKPQINIVVIGHAQSGKSTTMARLLCKLGDLSEDNFTRAENEAERERGITTEITLGNGITNKYLCTFIDVPGHHEFMENMIAGTAMADYAILIIDSTDEGFKCGMNSKILEHAFIAFHVGVKDIICCLNKMDELTLEDSQSKYDIIMKSVRRQLKLIGYKKVPFVPISGLKGDNIIENSKKFDWFKGDTLIEAIDKLMDPILLRTESKNGRAKEAVNFYEIGVIKRGSVASRSKEDPAQEAVEFTAKVVLLCHSGKIQNGDKTMLSFHGYQFAATYSKIVSKIQRKSEKVLEKDPKILNNGDAGLVIMTSTEPVAIESFSDYSPLGCFAVLEFDQTVAFGVIKSVTKKETTPAEKQN